MPTNGSLFLRLEPHFLTGVVGRGCCAVTVCQALVLCSQTEASRAGSLPNLATPPQVVLDGQNRHISFLLRKRGRLEIVSCHEQQHTCGETDQGVVCVFNPGSCQSPSPSTPFPTVTGPRKCLIIVWNAQNIQANWTLWVKHAWTRYRLPCVNAPLPEYSTRSMFGLFPIRHGSGAAQSMWDVGTSTGSAVLYIYSVSASVVQTLAYINSSEIQNRAD